MLEVVSTRRDLHRFVVMHQGDCREIGYQVVPRNALAILLSGYSRDGLAPAATVVESCGVVVGGLRSYDVDAVIAEVVEVVGSCDVAVAAGVAAGVVVADVVLVFVVAVAVAVAVALAAVVSVAAMEAGV